MGPPTTHKQNMSYLPLSSLPSKEVIEDDEHESSQPSTPYPRRPSNYPLLHSRRTSDSSTFLAETEDWLRLRQDRKPRRRILIYLCLLVVVLLGTVLLIASENHESVTWALHLKGPSRPSFLMLRPNRKRPPTFRRVLTNPLEPSKRLEYDVTLTLDSIPLHIKVGETNSLVVRCAHADLEQCAKSYRILFVGPTIRSTFHFDSSVVDERHVRIKFRLDDPGDYQIYGWPEFDTCDFWSREEFWTGPQFYKLAVGGTPFQITVEGKAPIEGHRPCGVDDDLTGRWVAKSYFAPDTLETESPFYGWVQSQLNPSPPPVVDAYPPVRLVNYRKYGYVYSPYQCKIPHRTAFEWLDKVKPESVLVIGDAVTRDFFCLNWGVQDQEVCRYTTDPELPYRGANKEISYTRADGGTTMLRFHWNTIAWVDGLATYIESLPSPPTHVYYASHLWMTRRNSTPEHFVESVRPFLNKLIELVPKAKIVTRTTTSAVQQLGCFELANIVRAIFEPVNTAYLELLRTEFPTVKVIDAYPIYNDRPESSLDGAKWERFPGSSHARPEEGAVSHALTDLIFETWRVQRRV